MFKRIQQSDYLTRSYNQGTSQARRDLCRSLGAVACSRKVRLGHVVQSGFEIPQGREPTMYLFQCLTALSLGVQLFKAHAEYSLSALL